MIRIYNRPSLRYKSRLSRLNIPLVNEAIDQNLFSTVQKPERVTQTKLARILQDYKQKEIFNETPSRDDGRLDMLKFPKLLTQSVVDHTDLAATRAIGDLMSKIEWIFCDPLPPRPVKFESTVGGWIRYNGDGSEAIPFPPDDCLVFDTENIVAVGHVPVMNVAVSKTNWYSWINPKLFTDTLPGNKDLTPSDFIDFGDHEQILIGHNVAFDRAKIKNEYCLKSKKIFLDTMSFHSATHGVSNQQQPVTI